MSDRHGLCPPDDELIELALGHLDGRDRSGALAHVRSCDRCSPRIRAFLEASEQLLLVAPTAEPPLGFETDVLRRVRTASPLRHRVLLAAAAAAAVVLVAVVGFLAGRGGSGALAEASMVTPSGRDVGVAWLYDDETSWVMVSVPAWKVWERDDGSVPRYRLEATLTDGTIVDLGAVVFDGDDGSWATTTDADLDRIAAVAVIDDTGRRWCEGRF